MSLACLVSLFSPSRLGRKVRISYIFINLYILHLQAVERPLVVFMKGVPTSPMVSASDLYCMLSTALQAGMRIDWTVPGKITSLSGTNRPLAVGVALTSLAGSWPCWSTCKPLRGFDDVIAMVNFCAVFGCGNRGDRNNDKRFFRLSSVVTHQGVQTLDLTMRKRWVAQTD